MGDIADSIFGGVANGVHWVFGGNKVPTQQMVFKPDAYDPIKGRTVRGFLDNPSLGLKTYIPPPPKDLDLIIGTRVKLGTHVTQKEIYKQAYLNRKMKQFNAPMIPFMQEERIKGNIRQERRIYNINGGHISSRDKKNTLNHEWKYGTGTPYDAAVRYKITN